MDGNSELFNRERRRKRRKENDVIPHRDNGKRPASAVFIQYDREKGQITEL